MDTNESGARWRRRALAARQGQIGRVIRMIEVRRDCAEATLNRGMLPGIRGRSHEERAKGPVQRGAAW